MRHPNKCTVKGAGERSGKGGSGPFLMSLFPYLSWSKIPRVFDSLFLPFREERKRNMPFPLCHGRVAKYCSVYRICSLPVSND